MKLTVRYHFIPSRIIIIKRQLIRSIGRVVGNIGDPRATDGKIWGRITLENSLPLPQEVKHRVTI